MEDIENTNNVKFPSMDQPQDNLVNYAKEIKKEEEEIVQQPQPTPPKEKKPPTFFQKHKLAIIMILIFAAAAIIAVLVCVFKSKSDQHKIKTKDDIITSLSKKDEDINNKLYVSQNTLNKIAEENRLLKDKLGNMPKIMPKYNVDANVDPSKKTKNPLNINKEELANRLKQAKQDRDIDMETRKAISEKAYDDNTNIQEIDDEKNGINMNGVSMIHKEPQEDEQLLQRQQQNYNEDLDSIVETGMNYN